MEGELVKQGGEPRTLVEAISYAIGQHELAGAILSLHDVIVIAADTADNWFRNQKL